ncbi:PAN domain-containing protein [Maricaulis salignorans]|uniref:PAN domain-containing protein n=1 Tax=Maricaulis salignorans TaxID=144026 RepID=A0A1G9Q3S7_9PROT|nr:PAN domain-containing protein [Maricaulis salignorans]SDM05656.1 PAN domain-containing protein [Maricaulis salignorans]
MHLSHTLILTILACGLTAAPARAGDRLTGWTRVGSVYERVSLTEGNQAMCASLCDEQSQCRSWVWTPPGLEGVDGQCTLLASTPAPRRAPQRVTGLASDIAAQIEAASERRPSAREIAALQATLPGPH